MIDEIDNHVFSNSYKTDCKGNVYKPNKERTVDRKNPDKQFDTLRLHENVMSYVVLDCLNEEESMIGYGVGGRESLTIFI